MNGGIGNLGNNNLNQQGTGTTTGLLRKKNLQVAPNTIGTNIPTMGGQWDFSNTNK